MVAWEAICDLSCAICLACQQAVHTLLHDGSGREACHLMMMRSEDLLFEFCFLLWPRHYPFVDLVALFLPFPLGQTSPKVRLLLDQRLLQLFGLAFCIVSTSCSLGSLKYRAGSPECDNLDMPHTSLGACVHCSSDPFPRPPGNERHTPVSSALLLYFSACLSRLRALAKMRSMVAFHLYSSIRVNSTSTRSPSCRSTASRDTCSVLSLSPLIEASNWGS